jgi:hypothetical protein
MERLWGHVEAGRRNPAPIPGVVRARAAHTPHRFGCCVRLGPPGQPRLVPSAGETTCSPPRSPSFPRRYCKNLFWFPRTGQTSNAFLGKLQYGIDQDETPPRGRHSTRRDGRLSARPSCWCSRGCSFDDKPAILSSKPHRHLAMSGKNSWQREPYRYLSVKSAGGAMSEFGLALALELRLKFQTGGASPARRLSWGHIEVLCGCELMAAAVGSGDDMD